MCYFFADRIHPARTSEGAEMIKRFICWLWGHKTMLKAFTNDTFYKWEKQRFCIRCGKEPK